MAIRISLAALVTCTLLAWAIEKAATRRWTKAARLTRAPLDSSPAQLTRATVQVPSGAADTRAAVVKHACNRSSTRLQP